MTAQQLADKYSRGELDALAIGLVDDPDSFGTKLDLAEAMLDNGYQDASPATSFEAAQGVEHVVNTPLNKFGLPDPERVVTEAHRGDGGEVTYKGGGN